jgi:uroporphyrinogen III methyltransferase/synthase
MEGGLQLACCGKVFIVGAGPGDYRLMTLRAVECIGKADVIVYDRLVSGRILSFAGPAAELVYVGKQPDAHPVPQERINEILVEKALEGRTVARVKGGDPFVFGRGGEEAEALRARGIPFEIVPGITSAIAVPAYAGIPVTHREFCSSLHIITGHERPGKDASAVEYEVLAKTEGTLVFLMGVKNLPEITGRLREAGKDGKTPAAVIEKGTTAGQRAVTGTLEDIAMKVSEAQIVSPAVTVIGKVAELREKIGWFPYGKLAGKRVIVTRSREQAGELSKRIEELGGEVLEFPAVKMEKTASFEEQDNVLRDMKRFQWLVFTSVNGVNAFFERWRELRLDIRSLCGVRLAAVGGATAGALEAMGLMADYVPEKYTAEELAKGLAERVPKGGRVLLARAEAAGGEMTDILQKAGIEYTDLAVYRTLRENTGGGEILKAIEEGGADFLTFTSSSTVTGFLEAIGKESIPKLSGIKIVCIGPVTAKTARDAGLKVAAVAGEHSIEGLADTLAVLGEKERGGLDWNWQKDQEGLEAVKE